MKTKLAMCTAFLLTATAGVAFADVPGITPLDFDVSAATTGTEAHWIWRLLASEIAAVIAGYAYCFIQSKIEESRYAKAATAIKDAVAACYHEYVREIKAAAADGKLTIEEKNRALQYAYAKAVEFARTQGVDLFKVFAKETVLRLIEKYVGEAKAAAVIAPLPDLAP